MPYVLKETLASQNQGHDMWFCRMTGIGPMTTPNSDERATFETREAALGSPAMFHALSFYEIVEIRP